MSIESMIETVTVSEIEAAQETAATHYEESAEFMGGQMIMIAFD